MATAKVTANGGVNVRSEMDTRSKYQGKLNKGDEVTYNSYNGEWLGITYKNKPAYIMAKFTSVGEQSEVSPQNVTAGETSATDAPQIQSSKPEETSGGQVITAVTGKTGKATSNVKLRKSASKDSKELGKVTKGTSFTIMEETEDWLHISYTQSKKEKTGWIMRQYTDQIIPVDPYSEKGEKVVNFAKKFTDNPHHPYVWGGKGQILDKTSLGKLKNQYGSDPYKKITSKYLDGSYRAFDCSGICCYSYKEALGMDVSEGHGWRPINKKKAVKLYDKSVKQCQLKIGDVIESANHFVMYIGNGKCVESCGKHGLAWGINKWDYCTVTNVYRYV